MISRDNILNLEPRRDIYKFILEHPGMHLREISRRTNISFSGLRYHLNFLKKQGLIINKTYGNFSRYFIKENIGIKDQDILNILRQDIPRRIILILLSPGPGIIYRDNLSRKKAINDPSTYQKTYSKKELIEFTRYWKGPFCDLFHLDKHRTTLDFHLEKLLKADLIEKIRVGRELKYKLKDEDMIWSFLINYKNALKNTTIDVFLMWQKYFVDKKMKKITTLFYDIFPHPYHI